MIPRDLGGGLGIGPLEPADAAEFASFVDAERAHLDPWLPWVEAIRDAESALPFLQRYADGAAADSRYLVALRVDGTMVGGALFRVFDADAGLCEIGVWLAAGAQGKGYIGRAVAAMLDWALLDRGLHRAEWRCVPENAGSRAVAERLGMNHDGTLRESWHYRDRWWDLEVWAMLAEEWRATRS